MADEQQEQETSPFVEVGVSGLRRQGGFIYEEFLRELQGSRWQRVIKQMVTDPVIGAVLFAVEMTLRKVDWTVQAGSDSSEDKQIAEFIEECLYDMSASWPDTLSEILSFLPWGWSYLETVYKLRKGPQPENARDNPTSKFSDGRIGWRKWAIRSQDTLFRWEFDETGGLRGMWQQDPYTGQALTLIPIEKSLLFRTTSRKNNPQGVSIFRSAYEPWYYRRNIARVEAIGIERDLAGYPVFRIPGSIIKAGGPTYDEWKNVAVNMRRDEQEALILSSDVDQATKEKLYTVELLSTGGSRQIDTDAVIARYNHNIAQSVMAEFLMLGSTSKGSYAMSKDKTEMFVTSLEAWCDSIAGVINAHAIPRLLILNGIAADQPPQLKHGDLQSTDLETLGTFINNLAGAGMPLFPTTDGKLESGLLEMAGLPTQPPEAFVEMAKADAEAKAQARADIAAAVKAKPNGGIPQADPKQQNPEQNPDGGQP